MWEVERMKPARIIVLADRTVEEVKARSVAVSRTTMLTVAPLPAGTRDVALALGTRMSVRASLVGPASSPRRDADFGDRSGPRGSVDAAPSRPANTPMPT
jgi:hypothetical protein